MNQGALTVVANIAAGSELALRQLLDVIQDDVSAGRLRQARTQNPIIPFADLETVHFARFVVLEPPKNSDRPARLIFATNYDGPRARHVKELLEVAGQGLQQIFSHCEAFKSATAWSAIPTFQSPRKLREVLEGSVDPNAFYKGHRGRGVKQIRDEEFLRQELGRRLGVGGSKLARDPHAEVLRICREPAHRWALLLPDPIRLSVLRKLWILGCLLLTAPLWLPLAPVLLLPWFLALRVLEKRDEKKQEKVEASVRDWLGVTRELGSLKRLHLDAEDQSLQNQLTLVTPVKKGWLRLLTLRVVLKGINFMARVWFDKGLLGGIPSIHFARWLLIDDGGGRHRLVFFSNYDGSWESYLGRFVDSASTGLTAVWSNTEGFPKSRWLFGAGSRDEQRFKAWVREKGRTTEVWYSAYPNLDVTNINNNSEIRRGLQGIRGLKAKLRWLRRL